MEKWVIRPKQHTYFWQPVLHGFFKKPATCTSLRLMPLLGIASTVGIFAAAKPSRVVLLPVFGGLLFWTCNRRLQFKPQWMALAIPALFCCFAVRTCLILVPAEIMASQLAGNTFWLKGVVQSVSDGNNTFCQAVVRQNNGVQLAVFGPRDKLQLGSEISVEAKGILPSGCRNPGGFDEAAWLRRQGIFLKAEPVENAVIKILKTPSRFNLMVWGSRMRSLIYRFSCKFLKNQEAALLSGLLLGDTGYLSAATQSDFRKAGLAHLTSVSGSNVSSLIIPATALLRKSRIGRKRRLWVLLAALISFGFLTGWQISVARAILMAGTILIGRLLHRQADSLNTLAFAALALLFIQPLSALSLGFWLSLTATASLLVFTEPVANRLKKCMPFLPFAICQSMAAVFCTQAAVLPLISQISFEINIFGLLANLMALPLAAFITVTSAISLPFAACISSFNSDSTIRLLSTINRPLSASLTLLEQLAAYFAHLEQGRLFSCKLNGAFWLVWLLFALCWLQKGQYFWRFPAALLGVARGLRFPALISWLILAFITGLNQPFIQVWFLDVGQGDAVLIRAKTNETVLIDGGKPGSGYTVLLPALDALGINRIDLAIATHSHADHAGGLIELIESGRIDELLVSPESAAPSSKPFETELSAELKKSVQLSGIKMSEAARDDTIVLGSFIRLHVLSPQRSTNLQMAEETSGNEQSLIIQATLAGHQMLLTADCTQSVENQLLDQQEWPAAEILKVAHHGSRMASSDEFLKKVHPAAAIISVGPNYFGHPAPAVLERLQCADCRILRTDRQGAIIWTIGQNGWQIQTMVP